MRGKYRGCEIWVRKEKCLAGYYLIYYDIFDGTYHVDCGFYDIEDAVRSVYNEMKIAVDDYKDNLNI